MFLTIIDFVWTEDINFSPFESMKSSDFLNGWHRALTKSSSVGLYTPFTRAKVENNQFWSQVSNVISSSLTLDLFK